MANVAWPCRPKCFDLSPGTCGTTGSSHIFSGTQAMHHIIPSRATDASGLFGRTYRKLASIFLVLRQCRIAGCTRTACKTLSEHQYVSNHSRFVYGSFRSFSRVLQIRKVNCIVDGPAKKRMSICHSCYCFDPLNSPICEATNSHQYLES